MKVLVIYGGTSSEREISLRSGKAVANALKSKGYDVELFDLKSDNIAELAAIKADVVYPVLHGRGGEDGTIQGLLELMNIPYVGSKVAASATCMDKILCKNVLAFRNIPTAKYLVLNNNGINFIKAANEIERELGIPVVLKASCQGSSIGITIVRNNKVLTDALRDVANYGDNILVERFIEGTELTVPVMKTGKAARALPIIEITAENEFYDYDAKYTPGKCHHIIPARISKEADEQISKLAVRAFDACGCDGLARVDFILDKTGKAYVLEINTIPGMTQMSLVPDSAKAVGIAFSDLCSDMIKDCVGE